MADLNDPYKYIRLNLIKTFLGSLVASLTGFRNHLTDEYSVAATRSEIANMRIATCFLLRALVVTWPDEPSSELMRRMEERMDDLDNCLHSLFRLIESGDVNALPSSDFRETYVGACLSVRQTVERMAANLGVAWRYQSSSRAAEAMDEVRTCLTRITDDLDRAVEEYEALQTQLRNSSG